MAMEMRMNLNLKMSQKLVMTPMLQQAIKLLPLARMELAQLIRQEIIENPVLEELLEEENENEQDKGKKKRKPKFKKKQAMRLPSNIWDAKEVEGVLSPPSRHRQHLQV